MSADDDHHEMSLSEGSSKKELLDVIGGHGPWQFRLWVVFFTATLCNATILFSVLFLPSQAFCFLSNSTEASLLTENSTLPYPGERSNVLPPPGNCSSSECSLQNSSDSQHPSIANYFYHTECLNSSIEVFARCVSVVAFALSAVFVYFSNKRFGRRSVGLASCLFLIATSLALCFADNPPIFLILRFIISLTVANIYFNSALTLTQYVHTDFKLLYFLTGHLGWGLAHFLLPLVSWLARDWKSFNLALSSLCMVLAVLAWWSPDSPSSFPSTNQFSRARKALKYAAFKNGYSTTDVDLLPHDCSFRQDIKHESAIPSGLKQKLWRIICFYSLFSLTFTTTFLYLAAKWHTEWFKVRSGKLSFSFIGTTEVSSAIVLLFLSCVVAVKHLWAVVSAVTSLLTVVTYFRNKPNEATSSAKVFTLLVFFASAGWTLVLVRTFCLKVSSILRKPSYIFTAASVFCSAVVVSAIVLETRHSNLLLPVAILHVTAGAIVAFVPDSLFGAIE